MGNKQSVKDDATASSPKNQKKPEFAATSGSTPPHATNLPKTMKAAVATGFGDVDENIFLRDDWPVPVLPNEDDYPCSSWRKRVIKTDDMVIRVLSVALAPGDPRILSGLTAWVQLPKSGHPYVIGSDVAGIVEQVHPDETKFMVGDYVVSRFELPGPVGGAAEYRRVKTGLSEKCPLSIPPTVACGLPASAVAAKKIVKRHMVPRDRVLVIGGSGAVGSSVLQYAKLYGASFVAAVSTRKALCESLGADCVIDYRAEKWWEMEEFQSESNKFDVVFDLVNGDNWTVGAHAKNVPLHPRKSKYVALMSGVATDIQIHSLWDIMKLTLDWTFQTAAAMFNPRLPRWIMGDGLDLKEGELNEVLQDVVEGKLKPVIDPFSPFPFTETGVRDAMKLQKSCHAQGKVVIEIVPSSSED